MVVSVCECVCELFVTTDRLGPLKNSKKINEAAVRRGCWLIGKGEDLLEVDHAVIVAFAAVRVELIEGR